MPSATSLPAASAWWRTSRTIRPRPRASTRGSSWPPPRRPCATGSTADTCLPAWGSPTRSRPGSSRKSSSSPMLSSTRSPCCGGKRRSSPAPRSARTWSGSTRRSARMRRSGPSVTLAQEPSSGRARRPAHSSRSRSRPSGRTPRCRISRTSAMRRSERARTSAQGRSPRTFRTGRVSRRGGRRSATTSASPWTLCSLLRSLLATMRGRRPVPSSPTTSPRGRSPAFRRDRSTRKGAVESGTIEQTLPGLEGTGGTASQLMVGRALSLTPQKRLAVVAGSSHPELATKIAGHLGVELTRVERTTFADGSPYFRFEDSVRGADMFIVQTAAPSIGEHLMELLIMVNAAKLASAKRITAVIPWYFYARQDKKSRPREPITARLVADLLETAGVDRVITMDLHAGQVQGFFRIPVDHMVAVPMFAQHIRDYLGTEVERVAVAPDTGRAKLAGKFAVMTDDIIDTGGTLCAGAEALREAGATRVIACATHALFNEPALERIGNSAFEKVVVTDTVPVDELNKPANIEVLSISGLLAETIQNVFSDDSVSAIFAGENQLF